MRRIALNHAPESGKQLTSFSEVLAFVTAGNATITLRSDVTRTRYTFNIQKNDEEGKMIKFWVKTLTGSDNSNDFSPMGYLIKDGDTYVYKNNNKVSSYVSKDAKQRKVIDWFFVMLAKKKIHQSLEVWHEGRCGRCGRKLTVPESIKSGIGPSCAKKGSFLQNSLFS